MLIGGHALPAYGVIRTTLDVDIAIAADFARTVTLHAELIRRGFQLPAQPEKRAQLFIVIDQENRDEIEVWTRPDGVTFDRELLKRRIKVNPFNDDFQMYAIGPEDFIVNKLSRTDRGVQDEQDVVSVIQLQRDKLDYRYLIRRARQHKVDPELQTLMARVRRLTQA